MKVSASDQSSSKICHDELVALHAPARASRSRLRRRAGADRHHDGRPPGLRQDDDLRQARALPAEAGEEAAPRRRRHAAPRRRRAAQGARQADRRPGLQRRRARRRSRSAPQAVAEAQGARAATSSSTTPPAASRSTSRSWRSSRDIKDAVDARERPPRHRRDDRPGRGQDLARRSTTASASRASSSRSSTATRAAARPSACKEVTGAPVRFAGMGETIDKFEEFRPRAWPAASSAWATSSA